MSDFEDPELERLLGRAGGAYPDVNLAYERLQVRVRRARRRRATVVGSATGALLVAFTVVALNRSTDPPPLEPSGRGTLNVSVPDDNVDTSVPDDTTSETTSGTPDTTIDDTTDSSDPASSTPTTVQSSPITRTFTGEGGSITVRLHGNTLTLVSHNATAGFSAEVHDSSGDRVEVRFESSNHETRIRVDLEDGSMDPSIEEDD